MRSIELFAGAGGLAMGISQAGFAHDAVVELDGNACDTIRANKMRKMPLVQHWPLFQQDVRHFSFSDFAGKVDLLAGGPPCQPFSIGGKHRGFSDKRNMFPELVRAIRETQPRTVMVENVRGLLRPSFARYFEYLILQISYPEVGPSDGEDWLTHLARLEKYHIQGRPDGLHYRTVFQCVNAAAYGVPQRRERVFIVGFRADFHHEWSFPEATHSQDALLYQQWVTGEYWDRHRVGRQQRPLLPTRLQKRITALASSAPPVARPFVTVRDALSDLPDPLSGEKSGSSNHEFMAGARIYPGHTGSPLDEPAKTLKAGDHGVPGGENMLAYPDGSVRYFTVRESARLQTFPDNYVFYSTWTETMRQLGNAVPVKLAYTISSDIFRALQLAESN